MTHLALLITGSTATALEHAFREAVACADRSFFAARPQEIEPQTTYGFVAEREKLERVKAHLRATAYRPYYGPLTRSELLQRLET